MPEEFGGNEKKSASILWNWEQKVIKKVVPHVPQFFNGYNLTLSSILWSGLIIVFSFFAKYDIHWLWLVSVMIIFQYMTDSLDGAIGRYRNSGLIKWGYYMDHFLDYIFLCSILIGYSFILDDSFKYLLFFILALFGGFMVNSYLSFAATNKFKISYLKFGPTEARVLFIIINTLIIMFDKTYMAFALPYVLVFSLVGLCLVVYRTQKEIWQMDMKEKSQRGQK